MKFAYFFALLPFALSSAPPKSIPESLYDEFTIDGKIPVKEWYFDGTYSEDNPLVYDFETIESMKKRVLAREKNYYGTADPLLYLALDKYSCHVRGKKVAIMGSTIPWYEAMVLAYGGSPVTIEYNKIITTHPDLRTMTVEEFEAYLETFDAIISISSFEHDGLGRYGDRIHPNGDLLAMEKTKTMLNKGGVLFLNVPVGKDLIYWNAHRVYGEIRLPRLFSGWEILDSFGDANELNLNRIDGEGQPVFVLGLE